jgi:hypothetical protein
MKHKYINPQVEIMKVSTKPLMHVSIVTKGDYGDGRGITLGSRSVECNIWDEEEDNWLE